MKYKLDCKDNFQSSMLFWLGRFVKYKLNSLSNKELKDPKANSIVIASMEKCEVLENGKV